MPRPFVVVMPWGFTPAPHEVERGTVVVEPPLPESAPPPRPKPAPRPARRARARNRPVARLPELDPPATVGGRTPWYATDAVPMRVRVAHWALADCDDAALDVAAINRAAAELADELDPIGPAPEVTPYRPATAAARERDRWL